LISIFIVLLNIEKKGIFHMEAFYWCREGKYFEENPAEPNNNCKKILYGIF